MWIFALIFFVLSNKDVECYKNRLHHHPPEVRLLKLPKEEWFTQKLDHFKPANTRMWNQRYYVNNTFFNGSADSPVFLMIGGEGEASAKWMAAGAWIEYAQMFGALCFQLEHRYYGLSRPTEDMSTHNLQYLNSEQALADLAYFISSMKSKYELVNTNKWFAFGGSYPGSLAAWLRYKYPHLVHAAISSSGPLLAKADFKEYNEVVADSLNTFDQDCSKQVYLANKHLTKLFTDPAGGKILTKKFNLCSALDVKNKNDTSNLADNLSDNIVGVVQYNKDNRITDDPTSKITIDDICVIMENSTIGQPLDRYAAINDIFLKIRNETCLNYEYAKGIREIQNITWSESPSGAGRQWFFQTCIEFGFYQTSTSSDELFGPNFPIDFFLQQCTEVFGDNYTKSLVDIGVDRTNILFGDVHLRVSRVVFVHGSIDPWHALGITNSTQKFAPSIYINGTAHCANMYPSKDTDLPQLKEARQQIISHIRKWLPIND